MKAIFKILDKPLSLVVLFVLFVLFNFLLNRFMPTDLALDLRFAYSGSEGIRVIKSMSASIRERYLMGIWVLDTPYMLVYLLLLSGLISKIWKQKKFLVLPFAIVCLDFFENLMVSGLLLSYPSERLILGYLASFFTTSKWLSVGICVVFILAGLIRNYILKNERDLHLKRK
ncbi:hypothetical protein [Algoriphagus sp. C2-6-M1]|uniref:hypothetical protein n=1 Tax=Algoriphagus persicinus TaxID=3108754 RepID=UPI002B4166C2|nr:hypothetical protein [Algoriphagus sp. C2-6-M1]